MPTKFDVFAEIIERAPCKARDLPFQTPVYMHLKSLTESGWIRESAGEYVAVKNDETLPIFHIIKYCLQNGLNHNVFFSKNSGKIVRTLFENAPDLRPEAVKGNKPAIDFLNYLEGHQFVLLTKKRPKQGVVLRHTLFENMNAIDGVKQPLKSTKYLDVIEQASKLHAAINPFDDSVFSFLSSSAGLEGATITIGETKELILRDIYPDKPQKDIQMVKNLNEAMHYVFDHLSDAVTSMHIKEINRLVMFSLHRHAGKYKVTENKIQGNPDFRTAHPKEVPQRMEEYCKMLLQMGSRDDCLDKLGYLHNELQGIHPFADGNSRTTRMVVNWLLMKHSLPIIVIRMGCFEEYMSLTKLGKRRDDDKLSALFYHLLLHESLIN